MLITTLATINKHNFVTPNLSWSWFQIYFCIWTTLLLAY